MFPILIKHYRNEKEFLVVDSNQLPINQYFYIVKINIQPHRVFTCSCGHKWIKKIEFSNTINISNEKTAWCPNCGSKPFHSTQWTDKNGKPFEFEPVKLRKGE